MTPTDPSDRYRVAIVGTGGIATAHATALAGLPDRVVLVAVCDTDRARADAFAAEWGNPTVYTDIDDLLRAEQPDLVHICTPPGSHVDLAEKALRARVPALIEKPPALSLAAMQTLADAERQTGVPVLTVFQHRFGSAAVRLRELIAGGVLGRPLVASCNTLWYRDADYFAVPWRGSWAAEGGGPTMGHGIHQFDLLLSVLGEWEEVTAVAGRQSRPTETEDVSMAIVRFASGALATIVNSVVSVRETSELRFDFENATVELEHLYGYGDADWTVTALPGHTGITDAWTRNREEVTSGHRAQLAAIFDAFDAGTPPPVGLAESTATMELVAAIYASSFTRQPVRRGEIDAASPFHASMAGPGAPWADQPVGQPADQPVGEVVSA
jgi:predicted dehydrogenase